MLGRSWITRACLYSLLSVLVVGCSASSQPTTAVKPDAPMGDIGTHLVSTGAVLLEPPVLSVNGVSAITLSSQWHRENSEFLVETDERAGANPDSLPTIPIDGEEVGVKLSTATLPLLMEVRYYSSIDPNSENQPGEIEGKSCQTGADDCLWDKLADEITTRVEVPLDANFAVVHLFYSNESDGSDLENQSSMNYSSYGFRLARS